jgi:Dyp-type peroxidase family
MPEFPAALRLAQRGLVDNPRCGTFVTLTLTGHGDAARDRYLDAVRSVEGAGGDDTKVVTAVSPALAAAWFGAEPPGAPPADSVIGRATPFADTGGDVWFYVKAGDEQTCATVAGHLVRALGDVVATCDETAARQEHDRKILGDHFYDGLTSPADPSSVASWVVRDDGGWAGGCWLLTQRFLVDWDSFGPLPPDQRDDVIGRDGDGVLLPVNDLRSHIKRARVFTPDRGTHELLRLSLPFGRAASGAGRERGVYFVAFADDTEPIERSLRQLVGEVAVDGAPGDVPLTDKLMGFVSADAGGYWYVPSTRQLGLTDGLRVDDFEVDEHWAVRSANGLMFYNTPDYLNVMGTGGYAPGDGPSTRILGLLGRIFERWQANWYQVRVSPRVPHLSEYLGPGEEHLLQASVAVRKGLAVQRTLTRVVTNEAFPQTPDLYAWQADLFRIDPEDVLAGVMPELSLGRGKEVMPYLREDERIPAFLLTLDESSGMGHVVPHHAKVLQQGLGALHADAAARRDAAADGSPAKDFYTSVVLALEGVQGYCRNWALLAERTAMTLPEDRRANLLSVADRMRRLATEPPASFTDAAQLVFTVHCCLHLTGDPVSIGRLDQLLQPFLDADRLSDEEAQDVIDALWVKLSEKATHNRHNITDTVSYGTTAVSYVGGNFPQGGGINQWVQQVTVGGYLPTADEQPSPAANRVTLLCLRAARRLPLNAPCLSLRLYPGIGDEYVEEAARALLSGGAHPILFNEDRMVRGLHEFSGFPLDRARDYACDGCYEPMIAGASEFAFSNVAPLDALELTLNQGAKWGMAGPEYLRGWKVTFRSPEAADIGSFDELRAIYTQHLEWLVVQFFNGVLVNYGNVAKICPDPLLSSVIEGCVETGRDLTAGGAAFHLIAPMFVGLATTIDSLYAIKKLVYDEETAVTTLPELLLALQGDWGFDLQEPFESSLAGPVRSAATAERYQDLRAAALALPRFGTAHPEVDEVGHWLLDTVCDVTTRVFTEPPEPLASVIKGIEQTYSLPDRPFRFHLEIGVGTFEGYVGDGLGSGASADGRRNAQPYPSDLSPSPVPQDLPPVPQDESDPLPVPGAYRPLYASLRSWDVDPVNVRLTNAAPVDLNVREDFPLSDMTAFVRNYAEGRVAGNLLTVTCADPDTYAAADADPERYELVRVRMGGWTEYFSAMFPGHQEQHARRPFFLPDAPD